MKKIVFRLFLSTLIISTIACSHGPHARLEHVAPDLNAVNPYTLTSEKNLLRDYEPRNLDGTINVVIEIPAGTTAKWEVTKPDGTLKWEFRDGKPRVVHYLGYPGNYGMIPRTLLPTELGGDGDPLDVIVLGPAVSRGSLVSAKMIGILKLFDEGEQDDKVIALLADTPLYRVDNLADLDRDFPGITTIVETWFINYKGAGKMESKGYSGVADAQTILDVAIEAFRSNNDE